MDSPLLLNQVFGTRHFSDVVQKLIDAHDVLIALKAAQLDWASCQVELERQVQKVSNQQEHDFRTSCSKLVELFQSIAGSSNIQNPASRVSVSDSLKALQEALNPPLVPAPNQKTGDIGNIVSRVWRNLRGDS